MTGTPEPARRAISVAAGPAGAAYRRSFASKCDLSV